MKTWMKYVIGLCVPLMVFMVVQDTAGDFYGDRRQAVSYVVDVPEPVVAAAEETPEVVEEDIVAEVAEEPAVNSVDAIETPPSEDVVASAEGLLTADEMAAGEQAARACASCHQFSRERNAVGPHLVGLGGRAVGSIDGFRYSDALMALNAQGAVWTAEELEIWLAGPDAYAPGTKMKYQVDDAEERRLIAGWLATRED